MAKEYIYAVARIHAYEQNLLTKQDLDGLLLSKNYEECIRMLKDKGYGKSDSDEGTEQMLKSELLKTWELLDELTGDKDTLKIFKLKADFHNLKLAIKSFITDSDATEYIMNGGNVDGKEIIKNVHEKKFELLPPYLTNVCEEAFKALLETSNGQLCDVIIDKACIEYIYNSSINFDNDAVLLYGKLFAVSADVKTALRCANFKKSKEFMKRALSDNTALDKDALINSALEGVDSVVLYLQTTEYVSLADALKISVSEFEKASDNLLIEKLREFKNDHFSIAPLISYLIAKETEIKAVRLILSAKLNGLDDKVIKERLREVYA